jgi:hypothetical protein
VSSKPEKPKSSQEFPAGTSGPKKQGASKPRGPVDEVQAPKRSQGLKKARLRLLDQCQDPKYGAELTDILLIKDPKERSQRLAALAMFFGIHCYDAAPWSHLMADSNGALGWSALDPCQIVDEPQEILRSSEGDWYRTPPDPTPAKGLSILLFPVHICISPLASERDVLDYVKKRWSKIRPALDSYHKGPLVIRKRKNEARDRFIWENREVPSEELAPIVHDQFHGKWLEYYEIDSIKHYMKKRLTKQ